MKALGYLNRFLKEDDGVSAPEYVALLALITVILQEVMEALGSGLKGSAKKTATKLGGLGG